MIQGSENQNENRDAVVAGGRGRGGKTATWALRAAEKVREKDGASLKLNPRNASQRQVQQTKQVLAANVVSLGFFMGDDLPFA